MNESEGFVQKRHQPIQELEQPRPLTLVVPPMRSQVNLSRIVRAASCLGVTRIIACGQAKIDRKIARDAADMVDLQVHRSLPPVIDKLLNEGLRLVGLEQCTGSHLIYDYSFDRQTALVVGNERLGIEPEILEKLDDVIEIPVHGLPYSFNAATATIIAVYEYCRQFPSG